MSVNRKILFVDDEPNILHGFQRQLRNRYEFDIAEGALAGIKAMDTTGPYAAVITDMRMPSMNGLQFLQRVRTQWPDTIRLMLTGNADQQTAIDAVNEGCVFRFLTKPCKTEYLSNAVDAALEQHALITAERDLLSRTLTGSVNLLADVLSLLNPTAFGKAAKIRRLCTDVCNHLKMANAWEVSMAGSLALIGCVTVPENILLQLQEHRPISHLEQQLFSAHPQVAGRLIERIPRLEGVAEIVRRQNEPYCVTLAKQAEGEAELTGMAVNVLKTVLDFQQFVAEGMSSLDALSRLRDQPDVYSPIVVQALREVGVVEYIAMHVSIAELIEGMILDENLTTLKGDLLLAQGNEINSTVRERLVSIASNSTRVKEPIRVLSPV